MVVILKLFLPFPSINNIFGAREQLRGTALALQECGPNFYPQQN
jgi:hypothetical protein